MTTNTLQDISDTESKLVRTLARHVAMDLIPIERVLNNLDISFDRFAAIQKQPLFQAVLLEEAAHWHAAPNTAERIKMKYLIAIEEGAETLYGELVDSSKPINHRADLLKAMTRLAGLDQPRTVDAGGRVKITINMGAERSVTVDQPAPAIDYGADDAVFAEAAE